MAGVFFLFFFNIFSAFLHKVLLFMHKSVLPMNNADMPARFLFEDDEAV